MKLVNSLDDFYIKDKTAVAIGYFDGFHIGHRKVIDSVLKYKEIGYKICLFSFSIDTTQPINKNKELITTPSDKRDLAKMLGVDYLVSPSFDDIKDLTPDEFLNNIIKTRLNAEVVACGTDFRFGKNAQGDVEYLKKHCKDNDIILNLVEPVEINNEIVSSTKIREFLSAGEIKKVNEFLGRPYSYNLKVNRGRKIGRTLDFPTINQHFEKRQLMPKFGVYTGVVEVENRLFPGAVNIGIIPTIRVEFPVSETHIVGFSGDLYDKKVRVGLIEFLRDEIKFDSKENLQKQITEDTKQITKNYELWYNRFGIGKNTILY